MNETQRLCRAVAMSEETYERVQSLAQSAACDWAEMYRRVLSAGFSTEESMREQAERCCSRCRNADGEEQGSYGNWYCRRCWEIVTHEGQ